MERSNHVFMAKVAEKSQRYEDMVEHMKKVAELNVELTVEERNMLLSGFKHVVGAKRASWRILTSVEQMDEAKGEEKNVKVIRAYKHKIETELSKVCGDALPILDQHLIPSSTTEESLVFYHKMKGDYYRYLAEYKTGNERKEAADKALEAYQMASNTATAELPSTHPIRLGLFMNLSVFYYEILKSPKRACDLAKQAHDEAAAELHTLSEESSKDSSILLQFLKDNIYVWSSDIQDETGEDQNKAGEVKI